MQEKPKTQLTEQQKRGCGALVILIVVGAILYFVFRAQGVTYSVNTALTTTSSTIQTAAPTTTYSINQTVTLNNLGNDISIQDLPKTTPGKFIEVFFTVENLGSKTVTDPTTPTIIDSQKREFQPTSNYWYYVPQGMAFLLATLQPDVPAQFAIIYELPLDSTGLQFNVNDLTNSLIHAQTALVNLGF
jgi:hypothetical protein